MKKNTAIPSDFQNLAVMHRGGGRWHVLVAKTNGGRPALLTTRIFDGAEIHNLDQWFDQEQVGQVLVVLPGSAVVCRTCSLPKSDPAQLDQALQLQAEAHVSSLAPPHRIAMAVMPSVPDETTRCGILIAWPESASFELPETNRPIRLTSDVVALASLLNGQRPEQPLLWLDREDGSIALALTHANGAIFRCTREDTQSTESWQRSVGRAIMETGLSVGLTDLFIDDVVRETQQKIATLNGTPAGLFVPEEIVRSAASRVTGVECDRDWWMKYGIATGALLARCDQLEPLTTLLASRPVEKPSLIRTAIESLSKSNVAAYCVSICILTVLFGPLLVHGLRLSVLSLRFQDIQSQLHHVQDLQKKRDMYDELSSQSWPMTKLLSDLATNTPQSIELNSIRINYGESITVNGMAKPYRKDGMDLTGTEVIAQMQQNLEESYVFTDTTLNWGEPNSFGHYEFSLTTRISRPFRITQYDTKHDFAKWTMQMRVDGNDYDPATIDPDASADAGEAPRESLTTTSPLPNTTMINMDEAEEEAATRFADAQPTSNDNAATQRRFAGRRSDVSHRGGNTASRMEDRGAGESALPQSVDIPEPMSKAQVEAMSLEEAQAMLVRVAKARRHGRLEDETADRLKVEFQLLIQHISKLKGPR